MLGMEIFHFGKEIFILFGDKVAFGEVSGGPGWTVIPNFRYKRQKDDTDHLNKQQPSTHADIFMRGMLIEMIEGPLQWIITHTVVIKSFIFFFSSRKRLGTYTAQHRTPAPLQHSADTATCNNNNYTHYTQTLCTRGTGGEVWSFFFFFCTNRPSLMSLLIWRKYRCLRERDKRNLTHPRMLSVSCIVIATSAVWLCWLADLWITVHYSI